jgi:hypothetical protein
MTMSGRLLLGVGAAVAALLVPGGVAAQSATGGWDHSLTVYMLGAGMDGTAAVGPIEGDVNVPFSDVLENLEFGAMASYRAEHGDLALLGDVIFMGLGATKHGEHGGRADVDLDQWLVELDAAWRIGSGFEVVGGVRYSSLAAEVRVGGEVDRVHGTGSADWVDPVVGLQVKAPLSRTWSFIGRADVGGFGVGSDLTWQALAGARVELSPRASLLVAYRALYADYEHGSGTSYFLYDVLTQGPMVGFTLGL